MKFGMFYIVQSHPDWTESRSLNEAVEQIELGDRLGLDEAWLGEHHFSRHGLLSGIFSFAGFVAARTERIRIGTAIVVLPFHSPVLAAEEAAMLDVMSGGRLDFGVGSGYQRREFEGLGVNVEESRDRFREYLDVIVRAWTEETLTYRGKYIDVEDVWVIPKPVQKPHPPLFQAISTSPASVEFAASKGMTCIFGGPTAALGEVPDAIRLWREKMEEHDHPHEHVDPPVSINIYVAPSVEEAEADALGREDFSQKILARIGSPADRDGRLPKGYEAWATRNQDRDAALKGRGAMPLLRGTPEVVAERLEQVRALGINHVFSSFGFPGLPHEKVIRSIEMFASEVMPHFRETPAAVSR